MMTPTRLLTILLAALAFGVVGNSIAAVILFVKADNQASGTQQALCAFVADLERRVETGRTFLAEHPEGAFGFTPQEIRQSVDNQQRTITALAGLKCPKRK